MKQKKKKKKYSNKIKVINNSSHRFNVIYQNTVKINIKTYVYKIHNDNMDMNFKYSNNIIHKIIYY